MHIIKAYILASLLTYTTAYSIPAKRETYSGVCDLAPFHFSNERSVNISNSFVSFRLVAQDYASTILMRAFHCR